MKSFKQYLREGNDIVPSDKTVKQEVHPVATMLGSLKKFITSQTGDIHPHDQNMVAHIDTLLKPENKEHFDSFIEKATVLDGLMGVSPQDIFDQLNMTTLHAHNVDAPREVRDSLRARHDELRDMFDAQQP
jgi:hypothetical protein